MIQLISLIFQKIFFILNDVKLFPFWLFPGQNEFFLFTLGIVVVLNSKYLLFIVIINVIFQCLMDFYYTT